MKKEEVKVLIIDLDTTDYAAAIYTARAGKPMVCTSGQSGGQLTNEESKSLNKYLQEIRRVNLLTPYEEVDLARRIRAGDQSALEKLVKANLRFVVSVARQYQNRVLSLGDLISEGNLGLIKAAQRFDETMGFKFTSYAVYWIRQSIMSALTEQSRIVRLPLNRIAYLSKIFKKLYELEQKFEREPSPDELAEMLEFSASEVVEIMKISHRDVSIDAPFVQGEENDSFVEREENSLLDVLENDTQEKPDTGLMKDSFRIDLQRLLSTLSPREADVITLYFGLNGQYPMMFDEIGEKYNLTRERVRQIKEKACEKLHRKLTVKDLKPYFKLAKVQFVPKGSSKGVPGTFGANFELRI